MFWSRLAPNISSRPIIIIINDDQIASSFVVRLSVFAVNIKEPQQVRHNSIIEIHETTEFSTGSYQSGCSIPTSRHRILRKAVPTPSGVGLDTTYPTEQEAKGANVGKEKQSLRLLLPSTTSVRHDRHLSLARVDRHEDYLCCSSIDIRCRRSSTHYLSALPVVWLCDRRTALCMRPYCQTVRWQMMNVEGRMTDNIDTYLLVKVRKLI
jgi:hypothetical protein